MISSATVNLFSAASRVAPTVVSTLLRTSPTVYLPRRNVLLRPEYWYFLDTEGNLQYNRPRRRYVDRPSVEEEEITTFSLENVENLLQDLQGDLPMSDMPNPYRKNKQQCVLCKYNVTVDYKNARLLSQFISRFTGRIYERQTTGLCRMQDEKMKTAIKMSRRAGYLPNTYAEPVFYHDPKLYDPFNPKRRS